MAYHNFQVNCWHFNSVQPGNNKIVDIFEADEGLYPIPYEKRDNSLIDEENPPDPPKERIILTFPGIFRIFISLIYNECKKQDFIQILRY